MGKDPIAIGGSGKIRVGLESTTIVLTDVGKAWFIEAYPPGVIFEYDLDGEFTLDSMGAHNGVAIVGIRCPMGIPYKFPGTIDGKTTFRMVRNGD